MRVDVLGPTLVAVRMLVLDMVMIVRSVRVGMVYVAMAVFVSVASVWVCCSVMIIRFLICETTCVLCVHCAGFIDRTLVSSRWHP